MQVKSVHTCLQVHVWIFSCHFTHWIIYCPGLNSLDTYRIQWHCVWMKGRERSESGGRRITSWVCSEDFWELLWQGLSCYFCYTLNSSPVGRPASRQFSCLHTAVLEIQMQTTASDFLCGISSSCQTCKTSVFALWDIFLVKIFAEQILWKCIPELGWVAAGFLLLSV